MFTRALPLLPVLLAVNAAAIAQDLPAVAHPEEKFPADKTIVWTPLFQAAWDRMNADLGGRPIKVEPPNPLMNLLDSFEWNAESIMPKDRWKVWSGQANKEFLDQANNEAAAMLGEAQGPFSPGAVSENPQARLVLALLDRKLTFTKALHRSASAPLVFKDRSGKETKVQFFGTRGDGSAAFSDSVHVLYKDEASQAVRLLADGGESVVLYMPRNDESFAFASGKVKVWFEDGFRGEYGSANDRSLHGKDDLRIPYLTLSNQVDFQPLLDGGRTYKEGEPPWVITRAFQQVDFEMTEKGAKVRAKVELGGEPFGDPGAPPPMVPRSFIFDKPFFVFLWCDGAQWPYFGAWLGDASSMLPPK
ncbi:hypothetical protein [Luteolibacter luteus]|uniref:Uncharacterized protein n=1 Tax=Luteolibacter luteus TaxID=2728835 RepID=A0A858RP75_9BACT|nr:hypothetical protein [Luteolibacter luteus]QJE98314.1 hypothetical protein HHL09_21865 [Luteolibacter luteus]